MKIKRTGGRTPVVVVEKPRGRRRLLKSRASLIDAEALTGPLPGHMLVLLSRLHRSEQLRPDDDQVA